MSSRKRRELQSYPIRKSIIRVLNYSLNEQWQITLNDGLDNFTIDSGQVNTKESSKNQKDSQQDQIKDLLRLPSWDDNANQFFNSLEEDVIYISFSALMLLKKLPSFFMP